MFSRLISTSRRNRARSRRTGTATVEFAICLPLLMSIVLGVIEATNAVFLQQALTSAAYEAANVASTSGGTTANAQTRANAVLTSLGVKSATVTLSPAITSTTATGTKIVVTCSAALGANSPVFGYFGTPTLNAAVTIPRL